MEFSPPRTSGAVHRGAQRLKVSILSHFVFSSHGMQFSALVACVAALLPLLTSAFTISDVTSKAAATFAKRDTVSDILTDIENAASCTACEVQHLARPS
jgi:hypothetical protein